MPSSSSTNIHPTTTHEWRKRRSNYHFDIDDKGYLMWLWHWKNMFSIAKQEHYVPNKVVIMIIVGDSVCVGFIQQNSGKCHNKLIQIETLNDKIVICNNYLYHVICIQKIPICRILILLLEIKDITMNELLELNQIYSSTSFQTIAS